MSNKRIELNLPDDWVNWSAENSDGPPTFSKDGYDGVFQISVQARYSSGQKPEPDGRQLLQLAREHGLRLGLGELKAESEGACGIGRFGRVTFLNSTDGWIHLWFLTDGWDFIMATYIHPVPITTEEIADLSSILRNLRYG